ncbi:hypothetical protein [Pedobacter sp. KBS0701]|nr:hypothetical protein [Pedobacter sp. KBS0701]
MAQFPNDEPKTVNGHQVFAKTGFNPDKTRNQIKINNTMDRFNQADNWK